MSGIICLFIPVFYRSTAIMLELGKKIKRSYLSLTTLTGFKGYKPISGGSTLLSLPLLNAFGFMNNVTI